MGGSSKIMDRPLAGKKVAILIESEFITKEMDWYETFFEKCGAQVDFMTNMEGQKKKTVYSDRVSPYTENHERSKQQAIDVTIDIAASNPNDYAIVITGANYVACRLREIPPTGCVGDASMVRSPAAVRFMAAAMMNPYIVKGALCHALWILTPVPELLKGRKVICHTVVLADVLNAGAIYEPNEDHVVVDRDLVTGRSAADLINFTETLYSTFVEIDQKRKALEVASREKNKELEDELNKEYQIILDENEKNKLKKSYDEEEQ